MILLSQQPQLQSVESIDGTIGYDAAIRMPFRQRLLLRTRSIRFGLCLPALARAGDARQPGPSRLHLSARLYSRGCGLALHAGPLTCRSSIDCAVSDVLSTAQRAFDEADRGVSRPRRRHLRRQSNLRRLRRHPAGCPPPPIRPSPPPPSPSFYSLEHNGSKRKDRWWRRWRRWPQVEARNESQEGSEVDCAQEAQRRCLALASEGASCCLSESPVSRLSCAQTVQWARDWVSLESFVQCEVIRVDCFT